MNNPGWVAVSFHTSMKHAFWKKRTEFRFGAPADCFRTGNLGSAHPRDLRFAVANDASDVLKGDWDERRRDLTEHAAEDRPADEPVTLVIGRHGDPIVRTGEADVLRAQSDGLAEIPVRIALAHPLWQRFRNQILNFCDAHKGAVYQKIDHPDLGRVPYLLGDERLEIIRPHVPIPTGTVLDIGANWGYWSHAFERLGFTCTAVDHSPKNAWFLERIRRAMNRTFTFRHTSVFDISGTLEYDIVLALNIFHHFIRTQPMYERLRDLLARIDAEFMFFEPHRAEELEQKACYKNMESEEFVAFVLEHSCFRESRRLGTVANGRQIFLLSR